MAVVIKYADNILKGFACSISICVSAVVAYSVLKGDDGLYGFLGKKLNVSAHVDFKFLTRRTSSSTLRSASCSFSDLRW